MNNSKIIFSGLLLLIILTPPVIRSEESAAEKSDSAFKRWLTGDYLLGDWGGARTKLSEQGIDLEFFYIGSMPCNVQGGIKTGAQYQGALLMALDLNSEKLAGYHGGNFHASSLWLNGRDDFSAEHIGDYNRVNLVDYPNAFRLWELWYSQKLFADKVMLKGGLMSVDRDFIVPDYYNSITSINFLNQTFFYPSLAFNVSDISGFPPGNHGLPSTPYGALGILLRVEATKNIYVQAAVYDGNPDRSYHGTDIRLGNDEGALAYFETGFRLNAATNEPGLPGSYKIGGYYHTDEFADVYQGTTVAIAAGGGVVLPAASEHSGNYGVYGLAEQYLWLEKDKSDPAMQGILSFFRVAAAPKDPNLTQFEMTGGLVFKGLIPSRDWDALGIGASYLKFSDDIRSAVRDANTTFGTSFKLPDYEGLVEVSYKAQLTAWWTVQPSIQWVLHPGGRTDLARQPGDAVAFILQTTLRF
jgi:porin